MFFLEEIKNELDSFTSPGSSKNKIDIQTFLGTKIIWQLHKSILCGEYYQPEKVKIIKDALLKFEFEMDSGKAHSWKEIGNNFEIKEKIRIIQNRYFSVFEELSEKVSINLENFLKGKQQEGFDITTFQNFDLKKEFAELLTSKPSDHSKISDDSIYRINLSLAYIDETLSCEESTLTDLEKLNNFLQKVRIDLHLYNANEILQILKDKIDFLKFKIYYRDNHPKYNLKKAIKYFPSLKNTANVFNCFYEKIQEHCRILNHRELQEIQDEIESYSKTMVIHNHRVEKYHHINHDLRRGSGVYDKYTRVGQFLKGISSKEGQDAHMEEWKLISPFNKVAYQSLFNLLKNTHITLELKQQEDWNFVTIENNIKKYISGKEVLKKNFTSTYLIKLTDFASERDTIPDFYCFRTFLDFLDHTIEYFKSNPKSLIEFDRESDKNQDIEKKKKKIFEMIEYFKKIYSDTHNELKYNFMKLRNHKALPIYLTDKECMTKYLIDGRPLFLRSSYILPINYNNIQKEIDSKQILLEAQYTTLKSSFEIELERYSIENKFNEFDKKVKENEFKIVQIVAMFVSIAAFVLLNVKIFDGRTGLESFGIILGLAACFVLFNLFFYFITIAQIKKGGISYPVIAMILIFTAIATYLFVESRNLLFSEGEWTTKQVRELQNDLEKLKEKYQPDTIYKVKSIIDTTIK